MQQNQKKKILAISGSTRKNSTNAHLIQAIVELTRTVFDIHIYENIASLPHFNPDISTDDIDGALKHFKQLIRYSDAVIISTPEYAHGVPGTLKNAIDWTVSSSEFYQKPTLLITASTDGSFGHKSLLETLKVIEAKAVDQLQMVIPFAKTKVNQDHKITDAGTLNQLKRHLKALEELLYLQKQQNISEN